MIGGQASSTTRIENYLGFPSEISGNELTARAREQACKFGAENLRCVRRERGIQTRLRSWATGRRHEAGDAFLDLLLRDRYRRLGLPEEDRFLGAGVDYGAGASVVRRN